MLFTYQSDMEVEDKPARFTILIDADKKKAFDDLCAAQDVTSSQMIRQLIREYLDKHGVEYAPGPLRTKRQRRKIAAGRAESDAHPARGSAASSIKR